MASLTITAFYTRKFILGFLIFLGSLVAFLVLLKVGSDIKNSRFPSGPDPALVAFGKLPKLNLDEGIKPPSGVAYKIETISGDLKELALKLKVFGVETTDARFGDLARANLWATRLEFTVPAIELNGGAALYASKKDRSRILFIELTSGNVSFNSDYLNNQELLTGQSGDESTSKFLAQNFLTNVEVDRENYPDNKIEYIRYKIDNGKLVEALTQTSANLIQVNFMRTDLDDVGVVYSLYQKPKVRILVSKSYVVQATVVATKIQQYKFSTYPLKGIKRAYDDLKAGLAIYNRALEGNVFPIRNAKLAYLDTENFQPYLQPVYVFEGDNGMAAYVSAVSASFTSDKQF